MAINFCYDDRGPNPDLGYPNLARPNLNPDEFDTTWPLSIPMRLLMYLRRAGIEFNTYLSKDAPARSWYPIALGWHDHELDYFSLIPSDTLDLVRRGHIRVLFYYHEGDNPHVIKSIVDRLAEKNNLPADCYLFISANTAADGIDRFIYFAEHEHFFQYINRGQRPKLINLEPRPYQFTALNRTHKWWRASVMSDLYREGLLEKSLWSYNTECLIDDREEDNPIRIHEFDHWNRAMHDFLKGGSYICDTADASEHNDHRQINVDLHQQSYCHLVIETHFDADGSEGAFLTEKTYKCLKYGQPFVIIGTPGSLDALRNQGYRVFDHALDNSYDQIIDNTERWLAIKELIADLSQRDLHQWFESCRGDLEHNQRLFRDRRKNDLLKLAQYLDTVE